MITTLTKELLETVKEDLSKLITYFPGDLEEFMQAIVDNKIDRLKKMEGTFHNWTVHDEVWVNKKIAAMRKYHCGKVYDMLVIMYKHGYKLTSINEKGLLKGELFFKAKDQSNNHYLGFIDPCGNLTLSIATFRKENKPMYDKVLAILYRGAKPFVKHTIIQALMKSAGFSIKGG